MKQSKHPLLLVFQAAQQSDLFVFAGQHDPFPLATSSNFANIVSIRQCFLAKKEVKKRHFLFMSWDSTKYNICGKIEFSKLVGDSDNNDPSLITITASIYDEKNMKLAEKLISYLGDFKQTICILAALEEQDHFPISVEPT